MSPEKLKCSFTVIGGLVPHVPIDKLTKTWHLTEAQLLDPELFAKKQQEAIAYAASIQDPHYLNWVKFEWIWY